MIYSQTQAANEFGLIVEHVVQDEELHRVPTISKPKSNNGWYIAFNELLVMGDWQTGVTETFKQNGKSYTQQDRLRIKQSNELRIRKKEILQRKTARYAWQTYEAADQAAIHPYLTDKGIECAIGLKATGSELLVPLVNLSSGNVENLQRIFLDGNKRFLKGGRTTGFCCPYGFNGSSLVELKKVPKILICEGYATAASLYQMTHIPVLAAMNAINLLPVGNAIKEKWADVEIIFAGDDDFLTEEATGINPGKSKAMEAALFVKGKVSFPPFSLKDKRLGLTDWNDYYFANSNKGIAP